MNNSKFFGLDDTAWPRTVPVSWLKTKPWIFNSSAFSFVYLRKKTPCTFPNTSNSTAFAVEVDVVPEEEEEDDEVVVDVPVVEVDGIFFFFFFRKQRVVSRLMLHHRPRKASCGIHGLCVRVCVVGNICLGKKH